MTVQLLGIPYDAHSSYLQGPAEAPTAIRDALSCGSANWCSESGRDLDPDRTSDWEDVGDVIVPPDTLDALAAIRTRVSAARSRGARVLALGGDHLVTWPIVQGVVGTLPDDGQGLTILHFDAHPDLYDELDGDRYSHACPFARIMEEGLATRLVQLGIRTMTPHQRKQADRFGVEVHDLRDWDGRVPELSGPVYVSIDIDVLDPAFAPGISHYEPGGMSTRQLLDALRQLHEAGLDIVGADIVEVNPQRDVNGMTAMVGAKLVREMLNTLIEADARAV